jgi:membrane protease YdiL (CAAX protease family)
MNERAIRRLIIFSALLFSGNLLSDAFTPSRQARVVTSTPRLVRSTRKPASISTEKPPVRHVLFTQSDDEHVTPFDYRITATMVGGQSILILGSVVIALLVGTPNFGFGPGISFSWNAIKTGMLYTLPLGVFAYVLDKVEARFPALQDVSKATQRSVLALLGGELRPLFAFTTALALGLAAGFGEEMLFRGILQYELAGRCGTVLAVFLSSIIFGALHAVTRLYALLACIASVYFGWLYIVSSNLAVPIVCHAFYDVVALLIAHWTVSKMTEAEQREIALWSGPANKANND